MTMSAQQTLYSMAMAHLLKDAAAEGAMAVPFPAADATTTYGQPKQVFQAPATADDALVLESPRNTNDST